ncbi:MAG: signal peptidase I [Bacteroidetes bacterium]|nr:MAG: signal peptidase I [Bacteroidota bacterium]TAG88479.1 MAG: signal peptidase I [Bacteroidota bacterium]
MIEGTQKPEKKQKIQKPVSNRRFAFDVVLLLFLASVLFLNIGYFAIPIIGYIGYAIYTNPNGRQIVKEWSDAGIFAIIAASFLRWATMSPYVIPTSSMEGTQLVGDYLFVSKLAYGPRTMEVPLQVPLTDNKIWGTNIPSYLTWIWLPSVKLWGYKDVQRNNVVVFNYPADSLPTGKMPPVEMKTNYVKRCVGVAGDKLEIKNGVLYINDKIAEQPKNMQFKYLIKTKNGLNEKVLQDLEIYEGSAESDKDFMVMCSEEKAKKMREMGDFILSVERPIKSKKESAVRISESTKSYPVYPNHPNYDWNEDNFGPLVIPKKDETIEMTKENVILYGKAILNYEWHTNAKIENYKLFIDNKEVKKYTFKQNYYFMMGDNRNNSLDSRFWGFVPRNHVLGEASFTWLSLNANKGLFSGKIRWERMFTWVR